MKDFLKQISNAIRPTPALVYNVSVLVGLATVAAGVDGLYGRAAALLGVGELVLLLAVFERVLPLLGGRR